MLEECAVEKVRLRIFKRPTDKRGESVMFFKNKVSKGTNIRNRYNQVPHLTRIPMGK